MKLSNFFTNRVGNITLYNFICKNWDEVMDATEEQLRSPENSSEFSVFLDIVLANKEIPEGHYGWVADIKGTVESTAKEMMKKSIQNSIQNSKENSKKNSGNGFDIYELAKDPLYQNADYYDMHTGNVYHTAAYNRSIKFGLPCPGIYVTLADGSRGIYRPLD